MHARSRKINRIRHRSRGRRPNAEKDDAQALTWNTHGFRTACVGQKGAIGYGCDDCSINASKAAGLTTAERMGAPFLLFISLHWPEWAIDLYSPTYYYVIVFLIPLFREGV